MDGAMAKEPQGPQLTPGVSQAVCQDCIHSCWGTKKYMPALRCVLAGKIVNPGMTACYLFLVRPPWVDDEHER